MNIRNALSGLVAGLVLLMAGNVNAQLVRPAQPCDSLYVSNNLDVANTIHAFSSTGDDLGDFAALGKIARGLVFDPAGNLYAGIPSIPGEIRKITPAGAVSLFATMPSGTAGVFGLKFDNAGNLYAVIQPTVGGNKVMKITPAGVVSTFISGNGLNNAYEIAFDSAGNLYAANSNANNVTKYSPTGVFLGVFVNTGAGSPIGLAFDGAGNLYVGMVLGNTIRKYSPSGVFLGVFANTGLNFPVGIAFDSAGFLYVVNTGSPYNVTKYAPNGDYQGVFAGAGLNTPQYLAFGPPIGPTPCQPTAVGGPDQSVRAGDTVDLDGSASFDDNTASASLVYSWTFTSVPMGSMANLNAANTATPSFVADVNGTYVLELVVTDGGGLQSEADEVEISSNNLAPTAAAGDDQLVIVGTLVGLDGSGSSDPEMDALTYSWNIVSAPGSIPALDDANTTMPSFTPVDEGVYVLSLDVSDFLGSGTPDTVEIMVTSASGFAENRILGACSIVEGLSPGQVTTKGNQNAFCNFLGKAIKELQKSPPNTAKAISKLEQALERTDGCEERGSPDGNGKGRDWITDCAAQAEVYQLLNDALGALTAP